MITTNLIGGKLAIQYRSKKVSPVICGDTKLPLQGIPKTIKSVFKNLPKRRRTVTRAYGGSLSHEAVRHRVLRAFFNEELKVIKHGSTQKRKVKKQANKKK
jgi:large subunit ribosomal protein L34e